MKTISDWIELCIDAERERGVSQSTLSEAGRYLRRTAEYYAKREIFDIEGLSQHSLKEYIIEVSGSYGPPTVKTIVWALRKFGDFLVVMQVVAKNPAADLHHPKMPKRATLPVYLSSSQLRELLTTAAQSRPFSDFTMLSLFASTGARPHEIASLTRFNIRSDFCRIDIPTKGGWVKPTPLSPQMGDILREHIESVPKDVTACFCNNRGTPATVSWIQRMVREAGEDAGLPMRLTPKMLRHTFATHTADRHGKAITKSMLGHSSQQTTDVYTHLSARRFKHTMNQHPYKTTIERTHR